MPLDKDFFDIFACNFADGTLPEEPDRWPEAAGWCVGQLIAQHPDVPGVKRDLAEFLGRWDRPTVMQFIGETNMDWLADDRSEQDLKRIIRLVLERLMEFAP